MGQLSFAYPTSTPLHHNHEGYLLFALLALAAARPESSDSVEIEEFEVVHASDSGEHSLVLQTSDGTRLTQAGAGTGPDGAVESQGEVRFIHPNGEEFLLIYVANAAGYQPESSALPVAPAFPHPIPATPSPRSKRPPVRLSKDPMRSR